VLVRFQPGAPFYLPMKKVVAVIGGRACNAEVEQLTHEIAKKLAKVADVLVCGGLGGVMESASRGFKDGGGTLVMGILPGYDKQDANPYVDLAIPTGMGLARNVLVVKSADVVVALPGEAGTLSEIAYCLQFGIPVIGIRSWDIPGVVKADSADEVVAEVRKRLS
jgi:uncharacterized protein (TIGR00725 family)